MNALNDSIWWGLGAVTALLVIGYLVMEYIAWLERTEVLVVNGGLRFVARGLQVEMQRNKERVIVQTARGHYSQQPDKQSPPKVTQGALSATFDRTQLQMALDFAASSGVRVGDKVSLIAGVAGNPYGRDLAYAFIKSNWNQGLDLFGLYGPGGFDLSTITRATGAGFVTQEYAGDIKSFFSTNPIPGALHDLAQALEGIGQRVNWRAQGEATAVCAAP